LGGILTEHGQIEFTHLAHPDGVIGVIRKIVSSSRVEEYDQAAPVERQPRDQFAKQVGAEQQLATPHRMGADRSVEHLAYAQFKQFPGALAQLFGLLECIRVKINVCVKVADVWHGFQ
jgi:hypothetical protein